jgi:hypothetical protein
MTHLFSHHSFFVEQVSKFAPKVVTKLLEKRSNQVTRSIVYMPGKPKKIQKMNSFQQHIYEQASQTR